MVKQDIVTKIYDLSDCEYSDRHGSYQGMAGDKDGILINDEYWICKFPKSNREFKTDIGMSYNTSPLSEYIGSHVYEILGIPVHETILGIRNGKVVVACKDFCKHRGELMEMKGIRNGANRELSEIFDRELHYSATGDSVNLNEMLLHLKHNPILGRCEGVISRFWDMVVVDILIDNTDRNNGNWGLLYDEYERTYTLAPVYDNGNAFANKSTDEKIRKILQSDDKAKTDAYLSARTAFEYNGHILSAKKMVKIDESGLRDAICRFSPIIEEKLPDIMSFIAGIPCSAHGYLICSEDRKQFYAEGIKKRFYELIYPEYIRIKASQEMAAGDLGKGSHNDGYREERKGFEPEDDDFCL